jgi:hypothetical protein
MGKHEEALFEYQQALKVFLAIHGQEQPDVAASKGNICLVFKAMRKKREAKQMFTEAAGIRRQVLGADRPLTKQSERLAAQ